MTAGFIGLGAIGAPMATNILANGLHLTVWNRTASKTVALAEKGAAVAATPAGAAEDIVFTVLTDLPDVEQVLAGPEGLLAGWAERGTRDPVLVVMGTVSPTAVRALAASLADEHGVSVVDAPVSGGDEGARNGRLSIMVGGEADTVERLTPYFDAMGSTVRHLGPVGSGQVAKSCNQIVVAATVIALAETFVYARQTGLDMEALAELLSGGLADSELLRQKGWRLLRHDYAGGGALANQVKDLRFALDQARELGVPLPGAAHSTQFFTSLMAMGYGHEDHTAAQRVFEMLAGVEHDR
ncbi:MAG TPA: NAD(P)-dependent oxidoreductase [Candidatus Stackebrandtia excrementipullorum]|nr:NAD(P)-dependent oxidoreductase [Candidatus Stackebrandtia excrementipullorum]